MFTLLHLTDTHLFAGAGGTLKGVDTLATLQAVAALAYREHPEAAACLLTGDLSQDETVASYRRLAEAFQGREAVVLPGNHDDPAALLAGAKSLRREGSFFRGRWQVILLDSTLPGCVEGKLSDAELARLDRALSAHAHLHALVCLHHQPVPVASPWLDAIGLVNGAELFAVLRRHAHVRGVLWGHVHQAFDREVSGLRLLSSPATCIQFRPHSAAFELDDAAPGYRWLRLAPDGAIHTGVRRLSAAAG